MCAATVVARAARWSDAERAAIDKFARGFRPKAWTPDPKMFSAWHYLVLAPVERDAVYHYERPVVILLDTGCFSATDIFLTAFKGWRNVTLMGSPSGGGSGRAKGFRLPESGLEARP